MTAPVSRFVLDAVSVKDAGRAGVKEAPLAKLIASGASERVVSGPIETPRG